MRIVCIIAALISLCICCAGLVRFMMFAGKYNDVLVKKKNKKIRFIFEACCIFIMAADIGGIVKAEPFAAVMCLLSSVFVFVSTWILINSTRDIKETCIELSTMLVNGIEFKEKSLNGHSNHVTELTAMLYEYIPEYRKKEINYNNLIMACLLHDIGKLGISDDVINKKGSLDYDEWQIIKTHPVIGKDIVAYFDSFEDIWEWIYYHHERADGNGYFKIPGDKIPYPAKMIAIADTYSALTSCRPYREAKSYEECIEILKECRGNQLDAELVDIFISIPKKEVLNCNKTWHGLNHAGQFLKN